MNVFSGLLSYLSGTNKRKLSYDGPSITNVRYGTISKYVRFPANNCLDTFKTNIRRQFANIGGDFELRCGEGLKNSINHDADLDNLPATLDNMEFYVVLLPITVNLCVPLSEMKNLTSENFCEHPAGLDSVIDSCVAGITDELPHRTTPLHRKPPLLLHRCSRGGKTLTAMSLFDQLTNSMIGDQPIRAMIVSFNGSSNFRMIRTDGWIESPTEALYRCMTNQLSDGLVDPLQRRVVNWEALSEYIGSSPFVLILDEVNVLSETHKIGNELGTVLKKYFLDPKNRYLVMTSHTLALMHEDNSNSAGKSEELNDQFGRLWSSSLTRMSDRGCWIVQLPISYDLEELKRMHSFKCNGITSATVCYYGGIPALVYAALVIGEEPTARANALLSSTCLNRTTYFEFLQVLFDGRVKYGTQLEKLYLLSAGSSVCDDETLIRWPPCFIRAIVTHFVDTPEGKAIAAELGKLMHCSEDVGDGMAWEACCKAVVLMRLSLSSISGSAADVPLKLCTGKDALGAAVIVYKLSHDCIHPLSAIEQIKNQASDWVDNTFVLVSPSHKCFEQFDFFVLRAIDGNVTHMIGVQCKDNSRGARDTVPAELNKGHLLRSMDPSTHNEIRSRRWVYYSASEMDAFLGCTMGEIRRGNEIGQKFTD